VQFLVFNDQTERREGLKALLRQVARQALFMESRDWHQVGRHLHRGRPDLVVIDWQRWMQFEQLEGLHRQYPDLPIAALVDDCHLASVIAMMRAGALGVVPRTLSPQLIVRIFELVMLGGYHIPAQALDLDDCVRATAHPARAAVHEAVRKPRGMPALSPRQREIMRLLHLGNTNKIIARTLGISEGTVKIHLASIFRQLGAANRAAAVAIYNGWQHKSLQVLHGPGEWDEPRARHGARAPIPLRRMLRSLPAPGAALLAAQTDSDYAARRQPPAHGDVQRLPVTPCAGGPAVARDADEGCAAPPAEPPR
jgi:DNA-binding NarL/FixJ family response regulator